MGRIRRQIEHDHHIVAIKNHAGHAHFTGQQMQRNGGKDLQDHDQKPESRNQKTITKKVHTCVANFPGPRQDTPT